eukprot:CAMPEP_0183712120 /NCGR_PEP_ID=MMETSP0737-20130205/7354_1 /TAXON_ID=385413 /ORGANISM="Thalassiosira miniscula, Strain CCMP1093" /LENGTH=525 /DNA_ID=CAMNT_0025940699 /DNA_START=119 /DNA_END=1696 /DNA_ORIENTATION=-
MSNAQDLLSILNGARASSASATGGTSTSGNAETSILSFKAGKMNTTLRPNGKYLVEPDGRRGELHVVWVASPSSSSTSGGATSGATSGATTGSSTSGTTAGGASSSSTAASAGGSVQLQWKDRRTKTVVNTIHVLPGDGDATFERVETGRDGDRVYLLQCGSENRHFFWMQDKDTAPDEDLCVKVNLYMSDPSEAALAAGGTTTAAESTGTATATTTAAAGTGTGGGGGAGGMDNAELLRIMQGALSSQGGGGGGGGVHDAIDAEGARTTTVPGSESVGAAAAEGSSSEQQRQQQADALGDILENLGMSGTTGAGAGAAATTGGTTPGGTASTTASATPAGGTSGGLTLADLQGAMAGLATASPPAMGQQQQRPGPPLSELTSNAIIDESGILDDPAAVERLVALLPEGQRDASRLRENLRSPQVAQCLQRLTEALVEDGGIGGGFNSIIANFQLDPSDGMAALARGNPIEAFLNCLAKDVERKGGVKKKEEDEDKGGEKGKDGSGGGEEDKTNDGDGDAKMDES